LHFSNLFVGILFVDNLFFDNLFFGSLFFGNLFVDIFVVVCLHSVLIRATIRAVTRL
jgi:hypothetical protein